MDFSLTAEHQALIAKTRKFASGVLAPGARQRSIEACFERKLWGRAGEAGLTGLPVDPTWGGQGCDAIATAFVIETLAEECEDLGFIFSLCAHNFACVVPVWRAGSEDVQARWLRQLVDGSIMGAGAMTEAGSGSDAFALESHARETDEGFTITGQKLYVTNAPVADFFVVYARTESTKGAFGISAFAVPVGTPGLRVEPGPRKSGLASAPWGIVILEDCRVAATALLGERGAGAAIFQESMRWERICILAIALGATKRMLARCVAHVRSRKRFGAPIGQFQAVSDKVIDMRIRLEASQLLLYRAAWLHSRGEPADEAIAISKIMASESAVAAGMDAVQLFGAEGILADVGIDLFLRDMLPLRLVSGTSEIQRQIVARLMGIAR
jgi:alkylation response protein AidB-like acyl-CoA dehydrogenase